MITLQQLTWDNCFSYGEGNSIDLSDSSITQIIGTNGVGKSSIPLILEEVLYNKNSKGVKKSDIANREINQGYNIRLTFTKDEEIYEVSVTRKTTPKIKLTRNGEDISSHTATDTYKTLAEIIGIDFKTFSQIVYQNTNSSLQFLTATDTNRKKFLVELLSLEDYLAYYEVFKDSVRTKENDVAALTGKKTTTEKWIETNKSAPTQVLESIFVPNPLEDEQNEIGVLQNEIKNISENNKKIFQNNTKKELLKKIDIIAINAMDVPDVETAYDETQAEIGGISREIMRLSNEVKRLNELGNVCSACGQDISQEMKEQNIEEYKATLKTLQEQFSVLKASVDFVKKENEKIRYKKEKQKEWQDLYSSIDSSIPSEILNETDLQEKLNVLRKKVAERDAEIKAAIKENEVIASNNAKVEVIKQQTEEFKKDLIEINNDLSKVQKTLNSLELLKKAFSTNGLLAYKIENLVKELEVITNEYLGELSDGRFTLNFVVVNDKLNVEITDNGNSVDILSLSSGELARVNTSTLLAIRKLMSSISKTRLNVLFLDEVINVLDEQGRERLVEVLLKEQELNTYLVSHGWSHPLLEKIEVQKQNNISRLSNG